MADKMVTQRAEFDAVYDLKKAYDNLPAIVDDDYPAYRHTYEGALCRVTEAMTANGRFEGQNRYGLQVIKTSDREKELKVLNVAVRRALEEELGAAAYTRVMQRATQYRKLELEESRHG